MIDLDTTTVTPDEFDEPAGKPTCSDCEWVRSCHFEGAEGIGYCTDYGEFVHLSDTDCERWVDDDGE